MFYCPTRIVFGQNALQQAEPYLSGIGKKALLVCGKQSARLSGALEDVLATLDKNGCKAIIYNEVCENPHLDSIITGKELLLNSGCDYVIGIGGGSPIDAAKAISLAAANDLDAQQLYQTDLFAKAYPIVAIPTTSGTGSEVTQYSVLTDVQHKKKAGFGHPLAFPQLAILDARYTQSMAEKVTLHTGLDALSHLLEGLYSVQRCPVVYPFIYHGIASIMKYLEIAMAQPHNLEARGKLMQASLYGGMVIAQSSTTFQHAVGYPLTAYYNVPHGLANAIAMEAVMELYYPAVRAELEGLFAYLNCSYESFIGWLQALPFAKKIAVESGFIDEAIPLILAARNMALNPVLVGDREIRQVLERIIEN